MFLGFALGVISIIGGAKIATALLVMGLPILDGVWVITYRTIHGRSPLYADKGHLHHRLLDSGFGQRGIVLFVSGVSAVFGAAALLLPNREMKLLAFAVIGLLLMGIVGVLALKTRRPE